MPFTSIKPARHRRGNPTRLTSKAVSANRGQAAWAHTLLANPHHAIIGAWIIFAIHTLGLVLLFQPVNGLFDVNALIDQDWGLHFHHLRSIETFWTQDRVLTGYNPFFMAGYPSNTIQDLSIKFFEVAALAFSALTLSTVQWFKLIAFLSMASVPFILYFAARNFFYADDSKSLIALSAALLGTIYWWNSLPREMFFYGMIGFPVAAYLCIWGLSLNYRIANEAKAFTPAHFGWLLFMLVILPLHIQSLLIFLPPLIALLLVQPKLFQRNLVLSILGAGVLSLLANSFWLIPAIAHRGDDVSSAIVEQLPLFASSQPFTFLIDYLGAKGYWTFRPTFLEKGLRLVLLILGVLGTRRLIRSDHRSLGIMLASGLTGLFLLSYFGAFIPALKAWQPLRFKIPYDLFLVIGAAYAISRQVQRGDVTRPRLIPLLLSGAALTFAINLAQSESTGRLQLRSQLRPEIAGIVEWIDRETPPEGRILFEESGDETGFVHDGMYLSSFLPYLTGRQIIGGPINLYNDRHHFAEFHSGKLFKRDISTLHDDELRNYLQLYNIGAVVTFHPASIDKLLSIPGLVTVDQRIGPVQLMKVNQPLSWFVEGEGKVQVGANRLELRDLKGNPIVLKYHWVEGLAATPHANILPLKLGDDPIPFIKIVNSPRVLTLRVR